MMRPSFLNPTIYLVTMMDLLLIKVLSNDPRFVPRDMAYLHVLSYNMLTALPIPTVIWYQTVQR